MKNIVRHGEVILQPVSVLPKGAKLEKEESKIVVAHSETGHHHILEVKNKVDMSKIKVYSWNGETYLEVPQIAELWHQKTGKDVHKTHTITPSIYKVVIKKEFDYFAGVIKRVRD
jgi:hypothetical protein